MLLIYQTIIINYKFGIFLNYTKMADKFTIKQLYEIADTIHLKGIKDVIKRDNINVNDLNELLQNLITKQAIKRNKIIRKKISTLINVYTEDNNSVTDTISQLKDYINDEQKVESIKGKMLSKKESQDEGLYPVLIEDLKDYLELYDDMKTISDIIKNMKE